MTLVASIYCYAVIEIRNLFGSVVKIELHWEVIIIGESVS